MISHSGMGPAFRRLSTRTRRLLAVSIRKRFAEVHLQSFPGNPSFFRQSCCFRGRGHWPSRSTVHECLELPEAMAHIDTYILLRGLRQGPVVEGERQGEWPA